MESTSAAEAARTPATVSQRRRRCATQRQEIFRNLPIWNRTGMAGKETGARAIVKAATLFNDLKCYLKSAKTWRVR